MILEVIKKASAQGLTISFNYVDGMYSASLTDSNEWEWFSYSTSDVCDFMVVLNDFVTDPVAYTDRFIASCEVVDVKDAIENSVLA